MYGINFNEKGLTTSDMSFALNTIAHISYYSLIGDYKKLCHI